MISAGNKLAQPAVRNGNSDSPVISVNNLHFSYGDYAAVRGVDFVVRRGEVFALLGTNGAGKTTTLEILEGFRRPAGGEVRVFGGDPAASSSALYARAGIMLQEAGFIDELTVGRTVDLWHRLSARSDDRDRVLARVGLAHRRDVTIEKLSGGERRRLDFALAIWGSPELIILDEPTTGLDPESRQRLWQTVRELRANGTTVLLTTHYLEEAQALADQVAIMHQGRLSVAGTVSEVLASYPARITAEYPAHVAARLPAFHGRVSVDNTPAGHLVTVETTEPQRDLTALLNWANTNGIALAHLNATEASLHEIFLDISKSEIAGGHDR